MERLIITDACVLLKWVLPAEQEQNLAQALALRRAFRERRIDLLLPPLWFYEVGNVLTRKCSADAARRLCLLTDLAIPEARPSTPWQQAICELVQASGATFYDAAHHALARVTSGVFVTADLRYLDQAGRDTHIMPLSEWTS